MTTNDHRRRQLAAGHIPDLGGVVHNLVHGQDAEIKRHELHDRAEAGHSGADGQAGKPRFRDRGVQDSPRSELFDESLADLERALVVPHLLADEKDAIVAPHLFSHRLHAVAAGHLADVRHRSCSP